MCNRRSRPSKCHDSRLGFATAKGRQRQRDRKRSKRIKEDKARKQIGTRLWKGAREAPKRIAKLFSCGLGPTMAWGSEIDGLDDSELRSVDQTAAAFLKPAFRGRSLTAVLLMHGWPSWRAGVAPALRWAKEVWNATTAMDNKVRGTMSPKELVNIYKNAGLGRCWGWRQARGPISACKLSLARLGWKCPGAFTFISNDGVEVKLGESSPAAVGKMIFASAVKHLQRKLARESGDSACEGKIVSHEIAKEMMRNMDLDNDENDAWALLFAGRFGPEPKQETVGTMCPRWCAPCANKMKTLLSTDLGNARTPPSKQQGTLARQIGRRGPRETKGKTRCYSRGPGFPSTPVP